MSRKPLPPSFLCPLCKLRSFHPRDIEERFCAKCGFVDDVIESERILQAKAAKGRA